MSPKEKQDKLRKLTPKVAFAMYLKAKGESLATIQSLCSLAQPNFVYTYFNRGYEKLDIQDDVDRENFFLYHYTDDIIYLWENEQAWAKKLQRRKPKNNPPPPPPPPGPEDTMSTTDSKEKQTEPVELKPEGTETSQNELEASETKITNPKVIESILDFKILQQESTEPISNPPETIEPQSECTEIPNNDLQMNEIKNTYPEVIENHIDSNVLKNTHTESVGNHLESFEPKSNSTDAAKTSPQPVDPHSESSAPDKTDGKTNNPKVKLTKPRRNNWACTVIFLIFGLTGICALGIWYASRLGDSINLPDPKLTLSAVDQTATESTSQAIALAAAVEATIVSARPAATEFSTVTKEDSKFDRLTYTATLDPTYASTLAVPTFTQTPIPIETPTHTTFPTDPAAPVPTESPTPSVVENGLLYAADWSKDLNGWVGSQSWKWLDGMIVNDGITDSLLVAPFTPTTANIAIEMEAQEVKKGDWLAGWGLYARKEYRGGYVWPLYNNPRYAILMLPGSPNDSSKVLARIRGVDDPQGWNTYRLEIKDNVIKYYVNGLEVVNATDNRFLEAGQIGIWNNKVQVNIRSFKVYSLP